MTRIYKSSGSAAPKLTVQKFSNCKTCKRLWRNRSSESPVFIKIRRLTNGRKRSVLSPSKQSKKVKPKLWQNRNTTCRRTSASTTKSLFWTLEVALILSLLLILGSLAQWCTRVYLSRPMLRSWWTISRRIWRAKSEKPCKDKTRRILIWVRRRRGRALSSPWTPVRFLPNYKRKTSNFNNKY